MKEIEINTDKPYLKLNEKELEEMEELRQALEGAELKNADPGLPIKDEELKKESRDYALKYQQELMKIKAHKKNLLYNIGAFSWHKYGDKLDDAVQIAKELE